MKYIPIVSDDLLLVLAFSFLGKSAHSGIWAWISSAPLFNSASRWTLYFLFIRCYFISTQVDVRKLHTCAKFQHYFHPLTLLTSKLKVLIIQKCKVINISDIYDGIKAAFTCTRNCRINPQIFHDPIWIAGRPFYGHCSVLKEKISPYSGMLKCY